MSIYSNAVKNPITTLMVFIAIIIFGLYSLVKLPIDFFPEIEFPIISVFTSYPGTNAADIETNISRPLEDGLTTVSNLKQIYSQSRDNISLVMLEFEYGTDLDGAANDIRDALSLVKSALPDEAAEPVIIKFSTSMMPILVYAITANESYEGIEKLLEEKIVNHLNRIEGIGSIYLIGTPTREIGIDIDPVRLEAYNISVEMIGSILQAENLNMPAGNVEMGKSDYPLRVQGEFEESDQIKNIVIGSFRGRTIYLKDVATVSDTIKKMTVDQKIDGKQGIRMMVMKQSGANTVQIVKKINKELNKLQKNLPGDISMMEIFNTSQFITDSVNNLAKTLMFALIFVILVVLFFLGRWRATFIVVLTIPISLIVSFIYLRISGNTLNIISLSALSIAIGMVVDDAIVVLENITKHIERGSTPREASIYATNEVWLAVIATTLTVVAVFFPMTMVSGLTGIMFRQLGWIVSITIVTSTVAAISLTPMLSSIMLRLKPKQSNPGPFSYERTILPFLDWLDNFYEKSLRWALNHKKIVIFLAFAVLVISIVLATNLKTEFMPQADEGSISATIELQSGTRLSETSKITRKIEDYIDNNIPEKDIMATSAGTDESSGFAAIFMTSGSNAINLSMKLKNISERERSVFEIADQLRNYFENIPEIVKFDVSTEGGGGMSENIIEVEVYGYDIEKTTLLANELSEKIEEIKGATNINISRDKPKPELRIILDQNKMSQNGLNTAMVSTMLRNRVVGLTATKFREAGEEYDMVIRFKEEYRNSILHIENIIITNPLGYKVRLGDIGRVEEFWSPPNIDRKRRERVVTISVTPYKTPLGALAKEIKSVIDDTEVPSDILVEVGGAFEDQQEAFADLALLLLLSLTLVYLVMASQFESFKMPFIIMISIPFAFTGVILALLITGTSLSVIAALGAIMLVGIAVKNSIVLVDYINLMRDRGYELDEAITRAGRSRLRPVLMTAFTTILGMLPLALSTGEGSEIWSPMGISVIGGLIFSTIITMIIVPAVYRVIITRTERKQKYVNAF